MIRYRCIEKGRYKKMSEKIYAKTLNPEDFDYRMYDIKDDDYNTVFIDGGREFCGIDNKGYLKAIKQVIKDYDSWDYEYYYKNSIKDFLLDMLPKKENGKKLSPREMHNIKKALELDDEENAMCVCLSIVTGNHYTWRYLRGSCQGDVVKAFYPNEIVSKDYIDFVEAWYFGTGTEIEIHDCDTIPNDESEIEGWTFYTAAWGIENLKKEIKRECGYKDDDEVEVILWLYDRSYNVRHDVYKRAE